MDSLNNYIIYHRLGKGTYGEVYLAENIITKQLVAIKLLYQLDDNDAVERFYREIKLLISLRQSENVASIINFGETDNRPFYVMDYYSQGSLRNYVGITNVIFANKVLYEVSSVLSELDKVGGFHRDIKPDNIMLSKNSSGETITKLSDFGLARTMDTTIFTNHAAGSPAYMSPQALNNEPYSIEDDIYSLGITVTELFTGKRKRREVAEGEDVSKKEKSLIFLLAGMISPSREKRPSLRRIKLNSGAAIGIPRLTAMGRPNI